MDGLDGVTTGSAASRQTLEELYRLLAPFNRHRIALSAETRLGDDLGLDSLAVMELVAAIEDRFDISVPLNHLPEIHTLGALAAAIDSLRRADRG